LETAISPWMVAPALLSTIIINGLVLGPTLDRRNARNEVGVRAADIGAADVGRCGLL